jgi:hypothetical protein
VFHRDHEVLVNAPEDGKEFPAEAAHFRRDVGRV